MAICIMVTALTMVTLIHKSTQNLIAKQVHLSVVTTVGVTGHHWA
jgi:hypothetical protein